MEHLEAFFKKRTWGSQLQSNQTWCCSIFFACEVLSCDLWQEMAVHTVMKKCSATFGQTVAARKGRDSCFATNRDEACAGLGTNFSGLVRFFLDTTRHFFQVKNLHWFNGVPIVAAAGKPHSEQLGGKCWTRVDAGKYYCPLLDGIQELRSSV